jgi:hypothetical protein
MEEGPGCVVVLPIGYDDDAGIDYTLMVGFDEAPGGILEFFFCIIEVDVITGCEHTIWSGKYVSRKFTQYHRCVLREYLISVARRLLKLARPDIFIMTTYDENLPECALAKFHLLNEMFEEHGYNVYELERWCGKHSWRVERG